MDRVVRIVQQLARRLDRTLELAAGEGTAVLGRLPALSARASKYLGFDSSGDPVALAAPANTTAVSAAMADVLIEGTLAAARTAMGINAANLGVLPLAGGTMTGNIEQTVEDTITAGATQNQAGATALTKTINRVTVSGTDGDGVKLPAAAAGLEITIINDDAAQSIQVWPATGDAIDGGAADAVDPVALPAGQSRRYVAIDATNWLSVLVPKAPTMTVFTSTGANTWTRPEGCRVVEVTVVAGGGAGGGVDGTTIDRAGGAGGAGGAAIALVDVTAITSETATVGAGGAPGGGSGADGGNGGASSFGSHATAAGGNGGVEGKSANNGIGTPGAGGSASAGDVQIDGGAGQCGQPGAAATVSGSMGGNSIFGGGGYGQDGAAGAGSHGGGGGGIGRANTSGSGTNGAAGGDGIVIVREFY